MYQNDISAQFVTDKLKELKPILLQRFHINRIGFFGSFANGDYNEKSDIDILVDFEKPIGWEFFDIQDLLKYHLKRKIDLVSIKALKKQIKENILNQVIFV
jgi:predicted nucleotidyltransferase